MLVSMECEVKFHAFITWMLELYTPLKKFQLLCPSEGGTNTCQVGVWVGLLIILGLVVVVGAILVHIRNQTPVIQCVLY
jgi:hypothetical protein